MRILAARSLPRLARGSIAALCLCVGSAGAQAQDATPAAPAPAAQTGEPSAPTPTPTAPAPAPEDADAARLLHQFARIAPNLTRGASPETEADFAALAKAGVRSILSVDGAKPDVLSAKKHGIRYVHIPFGYDGIPQDKLLEIVKTFQVLEQRGGSIFVHCHHGKHRGPAASAIGLCVLSGATTDAAVADMHRAGTDPKYKGLYASVAGFRMPTPDELKDVKADLPSVAPVPALTQTMVAADAAWERLKLVKSAAWAAPADHPDVDPPHEATILAQLWREFARRPDVAKESEAFRRHVADSEKAAWDLATALGSGGATPDPKAAAAAFARGASSCTACHTAFRDNRHRDGAALPAGK